MFNSRFLAIAVMALGILALIGGTVLWQRPGAVVGSVSAQQRPAQTIIVGGEGLVYAEPDMAQVSLGVQTTAPTAQEAQQANATAMARVVDQLLGLKIDRKDIQTSGISLQPIFDRNLEGRSTAPTAYQANNQVVIRVRDLSKVASVIDTGVAAGANTLGGISFGFADDSRLRQEALAKAVDNAKGKAEAIAKAMGVQITGIHSIAEAGVEVPRMLESRAAPSALDAATPVMPGQQIIVGRVSVAYSY